MPGRHKPREVKAGAVRVRELDQLMERLSDQTTSVEVVSALLAERGGELLAYCMRDPDRLRTKGPDGFTLGDAIASYAHPEVVRQLLDAAQTSPRVMMIISETHELMGGMSVETSALARATLGVAAPSPDSLLYRPPQGQN